MLTDPKCDERRPLCRNCERHFTNLVACDFDEAEPTVTSSSSSAPQSAAESSRQASRRISPLRQAAVASIRGRGGGREAEPLLPMTIAPGRLDPFEMHPTSQAPAPDVNALMNHCE